MVTWAKRMREAQLPYMIVGSFAVSVHGLPRTTADLDVVVRLPFEKRQRVVELFDEHGLENVHERVDPQWGERVAADLPSGLLIEVFFTPRTELHQREYDRRVGVEVRGEEIAVTSPEDLILRKLVNTRLRRTVDYDDVVGVIARQGDELDLAYVREHARFYRVHGLLERATEAAGALRTGDGTTSR